MNSIETYQKNTQTIKVEVTNESDGTAFDLEAIGVTIQLLGKDNRSQELLFDLEPVNVTANVATFELSQEHTEKNCLGRVEAVVTDGEKVITVISSEMTIKNSLLSFVPPEPPEED